MQLPQGLVDRFRADLEPLWPFLDQPESRLGLAVSGGGDSLALLLLAHAVLPGRVEAATIDHRLRPESAAEAEHVAALCRELGVPHRIIPVSVEGGNLQDRARAARYAALGEWCEERGLDGLATAHQMDDQVETFIMRANRGSGVSGLSSIRALGTVPGAPLRLIRPLLGWRREELRDIVEAAGWEAMDDPSNENEAFDRIRIRKALSETDWIDFDGVAKSTRLLGEAEDTIDWMVGREYSECVDAGAEETVYRTLQTGIGGTLIAGGVIRSIFRGFGVQIDMGAAAKLVEALRAGRKSNVAGIEAVVRDQDGERLWVFRREVPRRRG